MCAQAQATPNQNRFATAVKKGGLSSPFQVLLIWLAFKSHLGLQAFCRLVGAFRSRLSVLSCHRIQSHAQNLAHGGPAMTQKRVGEYLLIFTFVAMIVQGLSQMVHLNLDWPAHAHNHLLRGGLAIVGASGAGIFLVWNALDTRWGWYAVMMLVLLLIGSWWVFYFTMEFGLEWELMIAIPGFLILAITGGVGLFLSARHGG